MTLNKPFVAGILLCVSALSVQAELTLAVPDTRDSAGLRAIADNFASVEGGTTVTVVEASYDELFQRTAKAAEAGSGEFDLILMDDPWIPYFSENGYLEELTSYFVADGSGSPDSDFLSQSLALCRYPYRTGPYICLPFVGNAQLFFYDWRQYERHGVLGQPETWDDVIQASRGITKAGRTDSFGYVSTPKRPGLSKFGYVYRGAEGNPIVADFLPILWSYGGQILDADGNVTIDTTEAHTALDVFLQLANYAPPGAKSYGAEQVGRSLATGVTASSINWPNWIDSFEDPEQSQVVGRIAYAPIPAGTTAGRAEIGHWTLGISVDSNNKQQAFDFMLWATSATQQKIAAEYGNPPVRFSVFTDPELLSQERFQHFPTLVESIQFSRPRPRHAAWVEMEQSLGVQLSRALRREIGPDEALSNAQKEIEVIVSKSAE